jgi:hypothetical protein
MSDSDWTPPPGMRKLTCTNCRQPFATKGRIARCPNCLIGRTLSTSPFDTPAATERGSRRAATAYPAPKGRR